MRQRCSAIVKEESAAVAIIVAILVTVFIGLLAFVVDIGYIYEMRRQLQSAADAAALAGMIEKIEGATDSEVLDEAREYALKNDLIDNSASLEVLDSPPHTEINDSYVMIGVRKPANMFFAPAVFGINSRMIYAQAKAKRVFVTGSTDLVPWGVTTLRATDMEAEVSGNIISFEDLGEDTWRGWLPVLAAADGQGDLIDLKIYNSQISDGRGFPQIFEGVGSIVVHGEADGVTNVKLKDNVIGPNEFTYLYVDTTDTPKASVGNQNYPASAFTFDTEENMYRAKIYAPQITETLETFEVKITAGSSHFTNAARLIVRAANSPIESIDFGPLHFSNAGGFAEIIVRMRDFEFEESYDLKVVSNPEAGNFNALDFRYIYRPPTYDNVGVSGSASDYYDNIILYPGEIKIGDIITTKTGNLSGPQTTQAIEEKIGDCSYSYEAWRDVYGKPSGCGRIISVPIVERIERITGQSDVVVVSIAEFYLENYEKVGGENVNITGVFLRYFMNGEYSDTPPESGLYAETVRLDKPLY